MAVGIRLVVLYFCFAFIDNCSADCKADDVAVYNVMLRTLWSEERFPKDYPTNRPKAQWSQLFGQSHNANHSLFKVGEVAREAVRFFAQFGNLDSLIEEGDEDPKVYDQFVAHPIGKGVGETDNIILADGDHSLISIICKLVPSPDWFIGADSLNLCLDSSWVDQITLDLVPLDAGAAQGLTFTAPRWETSPPEPVSRHGPRTPNHAAAGFYYPHLKELPSIAKVEFVKVKEYTTKELNTMAREQLMALLKLKNQRKGFPKNKEVKKEENLDTTVEYTTKNYMDHLKELEEEPVGTPKPNLPDNHVDVITEATTTTTSTTRIQEFGTDLHNLDDVVLAVANGRKLGLGKHLPRHFRSRLHHAVNRITPDDCLVSEWSDWSPCSVTCGFGDKFRTRTILRTPNHKGRTCPSLRDRTHCGNVNSCYDIEYFEW